MMKKEDPYLVLAYYIFCRIDDPHAEIAIHRNFFEERDITSRIYISEEGINGQMCGARADALAYVDWMHSRPNFTDIHFKVHLYHEHVFPRTTVKYRKQLVALDEEVDMSKTGDHISPKIWREMLEKDRDALVLDVRNDYEWEVGHFERAERPDCNTFREFKQFADKLALSQDPDRPVMMYCTGGIRCELYSSVLKEKGFKKVYQLDGGIINYGLKEGSSHWLGKLFVFDDRLTVPISDENTPVVGKCHSCNAPTDNYYNCANIECNTLFLCCPECLKRLKGCCQGTCMEAPVVRPYHQQNPHKPFRRRHYYQKNPISYAPAGAIVE